jgi:fructosamine-3-kinase
VWRRSPPGCPRWPARNRGPSLALIDYFQPVPDDVLAAYREILPVDPGFPGRRELWRLPAYLAVVAVAGDDPFGRRYLDHMAAAVRFYR